MKTWKQSKTVWLGFVAIFAGLEPTITAFFTTGDFTSPAVTNLVVGCLVILLRFYTTTTIK